MADPYAAFSDPVRQGAQPPLQDDPYASFSQPVAATSKRFGTGKSFDVTADGSLAPSESVRYGPESQADQWMQAGKNVAEAGVHLATAIPASLTADVAGLGALIYDTTANAVMHPFSGAEPSKYADPSAVRDRVQQYLTYQPSDPNSATMKAVTAPGRLLQGSSDYLGAQAEKTGIPYLDNVARGIPLAAANALGIKAMRPTTFNVPKEMQTPVIAGQQQAKIVPPAAAPPPPITGKTPEERARNYVESRTNLVWDSLSQKVRQQLTDIAKSSNRLEQLDATAVERQAVLSALDRPINNATRGQLTRDPLQQRREQLLKSTEQGEPLRSIDIEQNARLLENLDVLRGKTGAKAVGESQIGQSVQGALRARLTEENVRVAKLYREAEKAGELQGPVNIDKLVEYLRNHDDPSQVGYAMSRLKQLGAIKEEANGGITVSQNTPLTLAQLEGIRRAAVAAGKNGGTAGHYAKELKGVLDDVTDGAGGAKYQEARAARRAVGEEFERQKAVASLVKNRKMSTDRAIALEDTWRKTVLNGSIEDIGRVRASLERSPGGQQAWKDLQGATVDYIQERATGGVRGMRNQSGDLNTTWAGLKRAVDEIGDEKLAAVFGKDQAQAITRIVDAAQILKTEAPMLVKGSPTIDKLLTLIDKVPVAGPAVTGGIQLVRKAGEIGKSGREIRRATTSPLDGKK